MDNSQFSLALANSLVFSQELQQQQLLMQQQKQQQQTQQQQQQLLLSAQAQYLLAQHAQTQAPIISQQKSLPLQFQSAPFLQLQQQHQQQLQPQQFHSNNFFNPNDTQAALMQALQNSAFLNKTQQQNQQQYGLVQPPWTQQQQQQQQQQFSVGQIPGNAQLIDEQSLNKLIMQSQLAQLNNNKQLFEAPSLQQYFLQQQQQQQQLQQQQQVFSQLQQLIQQQTQQQAISKMVQEANDKAQINQFMNQDFAKSFSNPNDQTSFVIKQEVPCLSEKISSFTESPNISATSLPMASQNASGRCSISTNSHSNTSSMGKNFFNPSSPLFQETSTPWNLLFKQLQTPSSFPANSSTCIGSFSLDFAKQTNCGGVTPAGNNIECKSQKAKKKSNPKRNTIKNLGNQIISFMCNKSSLKIIQKIPQIEFEEKEFEEFKKFCEQYKNKMLKIADLRNIWISAQPAADEHTLKYHKIIRVLSRFYLNNEAVPKLLTSNKLKDRKIHLSIRRILAEKLKDPEQFTTLNQYSKK